MAAVDITVATATAAVGMATATAGGGAPRGGRTTTGALGAPRITGGTPLMENIVNTGRIIVTVEISMITIDARATVIISFSRNIQWGRY